MNRDEQVGAGLIGKRRAVGERDEIVTRASEYCVDAATLELALEP